MFAFNKDQIEFNMLEQPENELFFAGSTTIDVESMLLLVPVYVKKLYHQILVYQTELKCFTRKP